MADQRLFDDFAAGRVLQVVGAELIVINLDILIVDAGAMQMGDRLPFKLIESVQRNLDLALGAGAEIAGQSGLNFLPVGEAGLVEAVQVQFKAFRFHQIDGGIAQFHVADGDLRQAFGVQPRQLVQRPDIGAVERQIIGMQAERIAVQAARHALQQRSVIGIAVIR